MINIILNGEKETTEPLTIYELILEKKLKPDIVAVEYNTDILKREEWKKTMLKDNDKIEIIHFVGGG